MFYGQPLRPVGYGYHLHAHPHTVPQQQAAVAAAAHWPHGAQPSASNLTGQPIKLPPPRPRSESPVKSPTASTATSISLASSAANTPTGTGIVPITINTSVGATAMVHPHAIQHPQIGQSAHAMHPHMGQPVFKLASHGGNVSQQGSPTKAQPDKSVVMTAASVAGQPVPVHSSRMTPVLQATPTPVMQATPAGVSPPRYPHGMQRMPFMQPHLPPPGAAAFYGVHGTGPPYLLPSPNNMHAMAGFGPSAHHIQAAFPHPLPPPSVHMMPPRVAAGVAVQGIHVSAPMLSPGGTPQKQAVAVAKPMQPGMMPVSVMAPMSPPVPPAVDKKLISSLSAPSFFPPPGGVPSSEHLPAGYQFLPSAVNIKPTASKEVRSASTDQDVATLTRGLESKPKPTAPPPLGKFTGPYSQQSNGQFRLPRKQDEQILFQNPYLQREFHNYILQTEGHNAASSFMNIIQQFNRENTSENTSTPSSLRPGSQHNSVSTPLTRATHSDSDLGLLRRKENESPSKSAGPKRETVSVHLEEPPRSGSHDSVASRGGLDLSDHSDQSRRSSFSDRSRETSSPLALCGNGFPFSMQPGMGPVHNLSNSQTFGSKQQKQQTNNQGNNLTKLQQNGTIGQNCRDNHMNTSNGVQQRNGEPKNDLFNDVELPTVVDNMVKFIELDDKHTENELGNIHIGHSPTRLPPALTRPRSASGERQAPLYMRRAPGQGGSQTQPNLSYASALRSQNESDVSVVQLPQQRQRCLQQGLGLAVDGSARKSSTNDNDPLIPVSAPAGSSPLSQLMTTSLLPAPTTDPLTPEMSQPADPLDLLKNLNIKASPGTQALYQYFS